MCPIRRGEQAGLSRIAGTGWPWAGITRDNGRRARNICIPEHGERDWLPPTCGRRVTSSWSVTGIPVIVISAETGTRTLNRAFELGVVDYISRPFNFMIVQKRVENALMLYVKQRKLMALVEDEIYENEKRSSLLIMVLSHIVEFRNKESGLHVMNINTVTRVLLKHLLKKTERYGLTDSDVTVISMASSLHDIGKITIPGTILNKPGRLTPEEFEVIKTHSMAGARMLEEIPFGQDDILLKTAYQICRWHHERYDGRLRRADE